MIQLAHPEWSPDGAWLAFDAYNLGGAKNIYKIKANGSAKAINLTNSKKMGYTVGVWRP